MAKSKRRTELDVRAKELGIKGFSKMRIAELEEAVRIESATDPIPTPVVTEDTVERLKAAAVNFGKPKLNRAERRQAKRDQRKRNDGRKRGERW